SEERRAARQENRQRGHFRSRRFAPRGAAPVAGRIAGPVWRPEADDGASDRNRQAHLGRREGGGEDSAPPSQKGEIRVIRVRSLAVWAAVAVRLCPAQSPVFDVASVKVAKPPPGQNVNRHVGSANHGRVRLTYVTLTECIAYAYGVNS